jgi:dTMP kinase
MNGLFISFEGIDGAGKSTHISALAAAFEKQGREITLTREPGGTALAERLRELVLNEPMDAMTEALLVFAARRDHVQRVVTPALQRGNVVLCDRFTDATFAYQGGGRGFDWQILARLEQWVQGGEAPTDSSAVSTKLQPDMTIWFDLPPAVAASRLVTARMPDKFESQPMVFFEKVARAYAKRYAEQPKRFARINADQPPAAVWAEVLAAVQGKGYLR